MIEADINSIGLALKGGLINPETAVRWIMDAQLLGIVGALPEQVGKVAASTEPEK
jgi:hypothetical protein